MKKSLLSVLLLLLLLFAAPPAHAVETPTFSVTVPVALPVAVSADGSVSVASDARIVNNSAGAVTLDAVSVVPLNSWQLDAWGTDYNAAPVDSKRFSMRLFGGADASELADISAGDAMDISYDVRLAAQTDNLNEAIARIVFTVSWAGRGPLSGIAVTTPPSTTEYDAGAAFDSAGMVVTATYADGTTAAVTGWTVTDGATLAEGQTSVTVSYTEGGVTRTATTPVTVTSIATEPVYAILYSDGELVFQNGSTPEEGRTVTATYSGVEDTDDEAPWYAKRRSIKTVTFAATVKPLSTECWFEECTKLVSISGIEKLNTSLVTNMAFMFDTCESLEAVDVSGFDVSNVTNLHCMFSDCSELTSLDVSEWDVSSVKDFVGTFDGCSSLVDCDVSQWDTSSATTLYSMFLGCRKLQTLDLSQWNTLNVKDMRKMFRVCTSLTSCDLSGWNTAAATALDEMFYGCSSLHTIYASADFPTDTSTGTDVFTNCTSLVGGHGTAYSASHVDITYARIDRSGAPGYFTEKS